MGITCAFYVVENTYYLFNLGASVLFCAPVPVVRLGRLRTWHPQNRTNRSAQTSTAPNRTAQTSPAPNSTKQHRSDGFCMGMGVHPRDVCSYPFRWDPGCLNPIRGKQRDASTSLASISPTRRPGVVPVWHPMAWHGLVFRAFGNARHAAAAPCCCGDGSPGTEVTQCCHPFAAHELSRDSIGTGRLLQIAID